jgi:hypothetical protein
MIICCDGRKVSCATLRYDSHPPKNAAAREIVLGCILAHENTHADDIDCPPDPPPCLVRPPWKNPATENYEECKAEKAQLDCLQRNQERCGGDPNCLLEVDTEIKLSIATWKTLQCDGYQDLTGAVK